MVSWFDIPLGAAVLEHVDKLGHAGHGVVLPVVAATYRTCWVSIGDPTSSRAAIGFSAKTMGEGRVAAWAPLGWAAAA